MVAMNVWPTDAADGSVASEARWRKMGRLWAPSGVAAGVGSEMAPSLAYPNLTVRNGACWVDGHYCELLGDQVLAVTANGLAVVRFDPAANTAELLYRDGVSVPAQSPTGTWELPIAQISGSALVDRRQFTGKPTATAWGKIAIATVSATQNGIGTIATDIIGMTVTFTAPPPARKLRASWATQLYAVNANITVTWSLYIDNVERFKQLFQPAIVGWLPVTGAFVFDSTAGPMTVKHVASTSSGTFNTSPNPSAYLLVEDIGPL